MLVQEMREPDGLKRLGSSIFEALIHLLSWSPDGPSGLNAHKPTTVRKKNVVAIFSIGKQQQPSAKQHELS